MFHRAESKLIAFTESLNPSRALIQSKFYDEYYFRRQIILVWT